MKKILLSLALILGIVALPIPDVMATVSSNITKVIVAGDNISTSIPFGTGAYSVPVYLQTDIQVYTQNVATGTVTLLTLNNQYSVSLTPVTYTLSNSVVYYTAIINLAGGSSPYGALPTGTNLIINRIIPYTNLINITNYSATPATTWNQGYDRATMLAQQLYTLTQQAVLQPVSATSPISIPSANNGYVLCWSGTLLSNCANNGSGTPIPVPIPNSDLQTITQAGLVDGSSIQNLTNIPQSYWNALLNNIQKSGINWSSIPNYAGVNWANLVTTPTGGINWIDMAGIIPINGLFGGTNVGGLFGGLTSKSNNTDYQAATDGFVIGQGTSNNGGYINVYIGPSANPSSTGTLVWSYTQTGTNGQAGFCVPVPKNYYYRVAIGGTPANISFISSGS